MKIRRSFSKKAKRILTKHRARIFIAGAIVLSLVMMQRINDTYYLDSAAYRPLLNVIARGESGGNYNAHYGNPRNSKTRFTDMTISEVLDWQSNHIKNGSVSSAVGKYQIINTTLLDIVKAENIGQDEKFDEAMQDRLAVALLERRGSVDYINSKLSKEQFAENIAKEWAALPKATGPNPHASYYDGDGINKSNIPVDEILGAIDDLQGKAKKKE